MGDAAPPSRIPERVDTLLLLVGGNPLPNAVSAKALLADGGHVVLIESRETERIASRLVSYLRNDQVKKIRVERRCVEPHNPCSVRSVVNSVLMNVASDCKVGLNYTGGTKVMVAHSYSAVRAWAEVNNRSVQFSYLSPDGLRMIVEPDDVCGQCLQFSLGTTVSISFDDLLELHDWELADAPRRSGTGMGELIPELVRIQSIQAEREDWRSTVTKPLGEAVKRANSAYLGRSAKAATYDEEAGREQLGFPRTSRLASALAKAVGAGCSDLIVAADTGLIGRGISMGQAAKNAGLGTAWNLWRWMNGGWLEECAFLSLAQIAEECELHEIAWNVQVRAQRSQYTRYELAQFEIDCVAMRGYQVFVISCTTDSDKRIDKSKLFEAHMRATQLGGDEARFALVCTSDRPELVKEECRRDLLTAGQAPVEVFGAGDLASLPERLKQWILG